MRPEQIKQLTPEQYGGDFEMTAQVRAQVNRGEDAYGVRVRAQVEREILRYCGRSKKRREVLAHLDLYNNQSNYNRFMRPLVDGGYLVLTVPDKPNSKNQQYKTTPAGQAHLLSLEGER